MQLLDVQLVVVEVDLEAGRRGKYVSLAMAFQQEKAPHLHGVRTFALDESGNDELERETAK